MGEGRSGWAEPVRDAVYLTGKVYGMFSEKHGNTGMFSGKRYSGGKYLLGMYKYRIF